MSMVRHGGRWRWSFSGVGQLGVEKFSVGFFVFLSEHNGFHFSLGYERDMSPTIQLRVRYRVTSIAESENVFRSVAILPT